MQSVSVSDAMTDLHKRLKLNSGQVGFSLYNLQSAVYHGLNDDQLYPLQSVMKLVIATAALSACDAKKINLNETILIHQRDGSPGPTGLYSRIDPIAGLSISIEELITLAVAESDSTAVDALIERLGGISAVQKYLQTLKIPELDISRNERTLQSELSGITWDESLANPLKFDRQVINLDPLVRSRAWQASLEDQRDSASPRAINLFLYRLVNGELLSKQSTELLLSVLEGTKTGKDRIIQGLPSGWRFGHKTGTGPRWQGICSAYNDIGVASSPTGNRYLIVVMIKNSSASNDELDKVMQRVGRIVGEERL